MRKFKTIGSLLKKGKYKTLDKVIESNHRMTKLKSFLKCTETNGNDFAYKLTDAVNKFDEEHDYGDYYRSSNCYEFALIMGQIFEDNNIDFKYMELGNEKFYGVHFQAEALGRAWDIDLGTSDGEYGGELEHEDLEWKEVTKDSILNNNFSRVYNVLEDDDYLEITKYLKEMDA